MRVLQIIDTLDAGGAERMAVHYANLLSERIPFSGIVVTRRNGVLSNQLVAKVPSFILNKNQTHTNHLGVPLVNNMRVISKNDEGDQNQPARESHSFLKRAALWFY